MVRIPAPLTADTGSVAYLPGRRRGWLPSQGAAKNFYGQRQAATSPNCIHRHPCQMFWHARLAVGMPGEECQRRCLRQQLHGHRVVGCHHVVAARGQQQLTSVRQPRAAAKEF